MGRAASLPAETSTYSNGRSEMPVLLTTYGSRGDIEPLVGLAVRVRARGAQFDTVAAVAEGSDAWVSTGMMPRGAWL